MSDGNGSFLSMLVLAECFHSFSIKADFRFLLSTLQLKPIFSSAGVQGRTHDLDSKFRSSSMSQNIKIVTRNALKSYKIAYFSILTNYCQEPFISDKKYRCVCVHLKKQISYQVIFFDIVKDLLIAWDKP